MYDLKQWVRVGVSLLLLFVVWELTQPWAIESYKHFTIPGWLQLSFLVVGAGLIFPKKRRYGSDKSDMLQLGYGCLLVGIGLSFAFLP